MDGNHRPGSRTFRQDSTSAHTPSPSGNLWPSVGSERLGEYTIKDAASDLLGNVTLPQGHPLPVTVTLSKRV